MKTRAAAATICVALCAGACAGAAAKPRAHAGGLRVAGNHFVGVNGTPIRLIGVNRSGSEYSCSGPVSGGGFGYGFFQGPVDNRAINAMLTWDINAVALPLNEACWLGGYAQLNPQFVGGAYQAAIAGYVRRLNAHGIYVVLRLSGAAPGNNAYGTNPDISPNEAPMADADHSLAFWKSLAKRFENNHKVVFQAYDEPNGIPWSCVLHGCRTVDMPSGNPRFGPYTAVGDQAIVNAIRATGATQPILISGPDFAGDLSQWIQYMPRDPLHQLVAVIDAFDYSGNFPAQSPDMRRVARHVPVIVGGFGDTNCTSNFSRSLMGFADSIGASYLAWTWNTAQDYGGCHNAMLDDSGPQIDGQPAGYYTARPSGYGAGVRAHFLSIDAHRRYQ